MKRGTFLIKIQLWIVYLLLFLLPTQLGKFFFIPQSYVDGIRIDYLAPSLYLTDLVVVLLAVISFICIVQSNKLTTFIKKVTALFQNKLTIGILILIVVNIVFSLEPIIAIYKFIKFFELMLIFLFLKNIKIQSKTILLVFLFSTFLQLSLVTMQILYHGSIQGLWYFLGERSFTLGTPGIAKISMQGVEIMRGYGTFSHPNSLAGFYLLLYGFILFYKPFQKHTFLRKALLTSAMLLILFSFSKIAIVGFLGLSIFKSIKDKSNCFICRASQIILPVVLGIIFLSGGGDPDSIGKRLWLAQSSIQIIKEYFLSGVGFGNYLIAQSTFSIPYSYFFLQPVHNIFLLVTAELGILLTAILTFKIGLFIKRQWNNKTIRAIVFVIIFTGMFDHYWLTLQQNFLLVPVLFGLLQSSKRMVQ